jgi:Fe2+ transport system protein FeoA
MTLSNLKPGAHAVISNFDSTNPLVIRMMEMGLTVGAKVEIAHVAPFGGSIAVRCRGTLIALRLTDAALVEVTAL